MIVLLHILLQVMRQAGIRKKEPLVLWVSRPLAHPDDLSWIWKGAFLIRCFDVFVRKFV